MYLRFRCTKCSGDNWILDLDTEKQEHIVTCIKCGFKEYIEELFKKKDVKLYKPNKQTDSIQKRTIVEGLVNGIKPITATSTVKAN
jgi:Zn ribbon nucleic-acid-binding protein